MFKTTKVFKEEADDISPLKIICPDCGALIIGTFFAKQHIKNCYSNPHNDKNVNIDPDKVAATERLNDILEGEV